MCNLFISEFLYLDLQSQAGLVTFTLQAYEKMSKCLLLRVNESKLPHSFSILEYYLIGYDPFSLVFSMTIVAEYQTPQPHW